jgi:DNA-binding transcriptional ArsR family regulator
MNIHEAAGDQFVPAKPRNLPNRILRAFDQAMHLKGLPRGARDVLAELCRFVPQNLPFQTIFAHKKTIADRMGMSERSLYRHLSTLESRQLIEVLEQDRKTRNGRFTVARIRLTRLAAALIGLIEAPELLPDPEEPASTPAHATAAVDSPALSAAPVASLNAIANTTAPNNDTASPALMEQAKLASSCTALPDASGSTDNISALLVIHTPPSAKMAARHTLSEPTISKHQPTARTENGVPADLAWLSSCGVSRPGIFKLMGLAKARAKRLSDIVLAVRERLRDMMGGRLYAYLAKLATGPTDFAMLAANERKRIEEAREAETYARKARIFRERFRNVALTNRKQNKLFLIDATARFVQVFSEKSSGSEPLNDLREWIQQVESGMLTLATLDVERRFQR